MAVSNSSPNIDNTWIGTAILYIKLEADEDFRDLGEVSEAELTLTNEILDFFSRRGPGARVKARSVTLEKGGTIRFIMNESTALNLGLALQGTPTTAVVNLATTGNFGSASRDVTGLAAVTGLVTGRRYNVEGTGIAADTTGVYIGGNAMTLDKDTTGVGAAEDLTITGALALEIWELGEINGALRIRGTNEIGPKTTWEFGNISIKPTGSQSPISEEWGGYEVTGELLADAFGKIGQGYWNPATGKFV